MTSVLAKSPFSPPPEEKQYYDPDQPGSPSRFRTPSPRAASPSPDFFLRYESSSAPKPPAADVPDSSPSKSPERRPPPNVIRAQFPDSGKSSDYPWDRKASPTAGLIPSVKGDQGAGKSNLDSSSGKSSTPGSESLYSWPSSPSWQSASPGLGTGKRTILDVSSGEDDSSPEPEEFKATPEQRRPFVSPFVPPFVPGSVTGGIQIISSGEDSTPEPESPTQSPLKGKQTGDTGTHLLNSRDNVDVSGLRMQYTPPEISSLFKARTAFTGSGDVVMGGTENTTQHVVPDSDLHPPSPVEFVPMPWDKDVTEAERARGPPKSQFIAPPPLESPSDKINPELAYDDPGVGGVDRVDAQDLRKDIYYQGQRQPPVGMRIRHALNFLADEDIDRCMDWEQKVEEADKFLRFADANNKGAWSFDELGPTSSKMVEDGLNRVRAHRIFNKYHYEDHAEVSPLDPGSVPKPAARLAPIPGISIQLAPATDMKKKQFPQSQLHRPQVPVNEMYLENDDRKQKRDHYVPLLAADEDAWFKLPSDKEPTDGRLSNLSYVENQTYESSIAADISWVFEYQVDKDIKRLLPDGTILNDSADHFARERGARRAGLQTALRAFDNEENRLAETPWRRLVLPLTAKEIETARAQASQRGLVPLALVPERLPKLTSLETFPYTFWMEQLGQVYRLYSERARKRTIAEEGHNRGWVSLPSWVNGPYVFRGVDANTQYEQDMYPKMKAVIKMLEREERIAPRPLLTNVMEYLSMGLEGAPTPEGINFRALNWRIRGRKMKDLNETELMWLNFLTQGSINRLMVKPVYPRTALYLAFTDRLMRLMDDISPKALWPDIHSVVSVEKLLNKMHESLDGPVKKTKFYVHDALMWLDRLSKLGWCRFETDRVCYGWVQRAVPDVHPEHLITWPNRAMDHFNSDDPDDEVGAPRRNEDVLEYAEAIEKNLPWEEPNPAINDWYCALAFRLGSHLRRIENEEVFKWAKTPEVTRKSLHESLTKWQINYVKMATDKDVPAVMDVVARAAPYEYKDNMSYQETMPKIRNGIIAECVANRDMLVPARLKRYTNNEGKRMAILVRSPLWDWASPRIRGDRKQFFSLDRWPLNVQSKETRRRIENDEDLDPQQTWDPCREDPCPHEWMRPKARPYGAEKVRYRWGPRLYPVGDTPLQRAMIIDSQKEALAKALGLEAIDERPGLIQRVSNFFSSRPSSRPASPVAGQSSLLPNVDPADVPQSVEAKVREQQTRGGEEAEPMEGIEFTIL